MTKEGQCLQLTQEAVIKEELSREKAARNDLSAYLTQHLERQRVINGHVVDFSRSEIKPNGTIIDACAGPEGAIMAAQTCGFDYIGNDISLNLAAHLKELGASKVVISEFPHTPYKEAVADAVFFVFALNNIINTKKTLREADRLLTDGGVIVTADPGPTLWAGNILLRSILTEEMQAHAQAGKLLNKQPFRTGIPDYFEEKKNKYSLHDYSDFYRNGCLDVPRSELVDLVTTLLEQEKDCRTIPFHFQGHIAKLYNAAIETSASELGYRTVKRGLIVAGKDMDGRWTITAPYTVPHDNDWAETVAQTRKLRGEIGESLPERITKSETKLFIPILVMKK